MAKEIFVFGCFVFIGSLVVAQEQAPPIPEFRQYQFHELTPEIPNRNGLPCESIDVQFPAQPCSPIRSLPILDYIPPYHAVPMIPQAVPRPVFTPSNDLVTDYNRYPSASVKQAEAERFPGIVPDDEVPSQYV